MAHTPTLPDEATLDKILAAYEQLPAGPFFWGNQWLMAAQAGQPAIAGPHEGDLLLRHWPGKNSMPMWAYSEIAPDSLAPGGLDNPAAIALASAWLVPLLIRQNRELAAPAPAISLTDGGAGSQWISVEERLPEFEEGKSRVECNVVAGGQVFTADYYRNLYAATERGRIPRWERWNRIYYGQAITHWAPLPTAPTSNGN